LGYRITLKYTLNSSQTPKHIDTTHELDPGKPIIQLGIYSLDGDTLTLSIASAEAPRPKGFSNKADVSFVLKRIDGE